MITRRDLARRGLLAGGTAITATGAFGVAAALAQEGEDTSDSDSEILVRSITFVQQAILAYQAAIDSGALADFAPTAAKFATQERVQERQLTDALKGIGGEALPAPLADSVPGLTQAKTREDWLNLLVRTQNQVLAGYIEGQKELGAADLLTLSARNATEVGQQLVTLRQTLGTDPLPAALPSGSEKN